MLSINGSVIQLPDGMKDISLLDFIREHLSLTGTKLGCNIGQCGACTVHVDGEAMRSCQITVDSLDGKKITTIEGLADTWRNGKEGLHPVQSAWIENTVPQCGYCQAGQIMSAAALLEANQKPAPEEIDAAMDGNICRCGTYNRIREAIDLASKTLGGNK
ncbi:Isoquinoline 1-oxidoreductase alpha subunit [hydrothermal vent metagenome]|uniref:Isoquinoline 1-oxidoreductase alpha subunit n=1 Tax=hydrothermal vent metagenome TaxID=652676 RepID=A0A3B0RQ43_9ZZZZ